jgi:hypothetical protein
MAKMEYEFQWWAMYKSPKDALKKDDPEINKAAQ